MAGISFDSCTGRAISIRNDLPAGGATATAPIALADPRGWISVNRSAAALLGRRLLVVISAGLGEIARYNLIKAGIVPIMLAQESLSELQEAVESDPAILLTADIGRHDVRARGRVVRFDIGGVDEIAGRLLLAHRLLCSPGLAADDRIRLQRRLVAIGDASKVPGADVARGAWRLDRLLAEIAQAHVQVRPGGTF
ncbi:MAG TPA: hypothetical protein VMC03_17055 [Streptosporangiaceae bacterium]|nr:hypothetical protein [Streptosporangiaceae bacterium]